MKHLPIAATYHEGGKWRPLFIEGDWPAYAAILFDDGMIFDFVLKDLGLSPWRIFPVANFPRGES